MTIRTERGYASAMEAKGSSCGPWGTMLLSVQIHGEFVSLVLRAVADSSSCH